MIDNHMIHGEDKILSKGDTCPCGGSWESVEWCIEGEEECYFACDLFPHGGKCEYSTDKLRCRKCGAVVLCE